jgi:hypothetical protein
MNIEKFFQTSLFKGIIIGIVVLVILMLVFCLGVFVGTKRADFSFRWADEYHRNFGGPQGGFFGDFMGMERQFPNANGSFGQIIKIDNNVLTVKDNDGDNTEKTILVNDKTSIVYQKNNIKLSDLKVDDNIVVVGEPNSDGQIAAKLIRVMPALPKNMQPNNQPQN